MKSIAIFLFMLFSLSISAQEITKDVGDFTEVKVFSGLHVMLQRSNTSQVVISGIKAGDVNIKNVNGMLKLSFEFPEMFEPEDIHITVFYSNELETIDANEGSLIESKDTIDQENITLKTQEGAQIEMDVKVNYLFIKAITGGVVKTEGTSKNQDVEVNTGGIYEGYDLNSEMADVTASTGGSAEVTVTKYLNADVRFGGNIEYHGNPEKVTKNKVIGGSIKNKGI